MMVWSSTHKDPPANGAGVYAVCSRSGKKTLAVYRPHKGVGEEWVDFYTRKTIRPKLWSHVALDLDGLVRAITGKRRAVLPCMPITEREKLASAENKGHSSGIMEAAEVVMHWKYMD